MDKAADKEREFRDWRLTIPTRWSDNDTYGHVNNVEYYSYFDTAINSWLIEQGGLDIHRGQEIGVCAESSCRFLASVSFPEEIAAVVAVSHLGNSSVRYEVTLSGANDRPLAEGWFVHVFVSRATMQPKPIPDSIRKALRCP